jgi:N-acetylglutamate synthase/N-acetylornithine aminotransferase
MKPYKFLVPVGVAAAALAGNAAKANIDTAGQPKLENLAETVSAADQAFAKKYVIDGEEHTLLLKVSDQGLLYAQHASHSSHASHASHTSHQSSSK